jgi:hypothetical protein
MRIGKRTLNVAGMPIVLLALLAGAWGLGDATRPAAARADPSELYHQFVAAFNSGDVDGAVETFADDAVVGGMPGCVPVDCVGEDAIRNMVEFYVVDHIRITITSSKVSGNTATGSVEVEEDLLRAGGVERFLGLISVEVTNGKIREYRLTPDLTDPQTASALAYMQANSVTVNLGPGRDGDQSPGTAVFLGLIGGGTSGYITIPPGPAGVRQPTHIHQGTCAHLGAVAFSLQDIGGGKSLNAIDASIGDLQTGNYAVAVQKSRDEPDYVACGDIPAAAPAAPEVAPAPAVQEAPVIAPAPVAAPPAAGTGGQVASGAGGSAVWWWAPAAGGALLIIVGVAARRRGRSRG